MLTAAPPVLAPLGAGDIRTLLIERIETQICICQGLENRAEETLKLLA